MPKPKNMTPEQRAARLEKRREAQRRYVERNREKVNENSRAWAERNPEKVREVKRAYREKIEAVLTMASEELLTPAEVAARFRMTPESLSNWRREGKGPKFIRFNARRVMYRRADVLAWENARETGDAK